MLENHLCTQQSDQQDTLLLLLLQVNLLAKLPNDGSSDPLSVVYDVDLTIPADKVVRLNLMLIVVLVMMPLMIVML